MAEFNIHKQTIEPSLPDRDPISEKVSPFGGLKELSQGIDTAIHAISQARSEHVTSQATADFSKQGSRWFKEYSDFLTMLDPTDPDDLYEKSEQKIDEIQSKMTEFVDAIPDKSARSQICPLTAHSINAMRKTGLGYTQGILDKQAEKNITETVDASSQSLLLDPSDSQLNIAKQALKSSVNSSRLNPSGKEEKWQAGLISLYEAQARGSHNQRPELFDGYVNIVQTPSVDPFSPTEYINGRGEQMLEVADSTLGKSIAGVSGWNNLSIARKKILLNEWNTANHREMAKHRGEIRSWVRSAETLFLNGKTPEDYASKADLSTLMKGYSVEEAIHICERLEWLKIMSPEIPKVSVMTNEQYHDFSSKHFSASATDDVQMTARKIKMKETFYGISKESANLRGTDPVAWGIKHDQIQKLNYENPQMFAESLAKRSPFEERLKNDYGLQVGSVISKVEEAEMKRQRDNMSSSFFRDFTRDSIHLLPPVEREKALSVAGRISDPLLASGIVLSAGETSGEQEASRLISMGAKNWKDVEEQFKSKKGVSFDEHYRRFINAEVGSMYTGMDDAHFKKDAEVVKAYILGKMHETGDFAFNRDVVRKAVQEVYGNTPCLLQGASVLPPRGMSHDEFRNRAYTSMEDKLATLKGGKSVERYPEMYGLLSSSGRGKYFLTRRGIKERDSDGHPIIIDIYEGSPDPYINKSVVAGLQEPIYASELFY